MTEEKQTLLIVDDAVENIDIVKSLFKGKYKIKVATNGKKALQLIEKSKNKPDLILLDVVMPEMNGFETIKELKKHDNTKTIPVIFLTSEKEPDSMVQAFSLGAVDYVGKPFNIDELKSRVNSHLLIKKQTDFIADQNLKYREILHILSHDLKNSVGAIKMAVDMKAINPEISLDQFAPTIELATQNSINLINMTCELCRMNEYNLVSTNVNIMETFKEAKLLLSKRIKSKNITISLSIPTEFTVLVEKRAFLNSVVLNLLTNAIKFSPQDSTIKVKASKISEDKINISVIDKGIGIPTKMIDTLFDATVSKVRTGTKGEKGSGFGLPMVKKFIDIFDGELKVISKTINEFPEEHGTEFKITLFSKKD
jgi:signal transduction histidine kinase